MPPPDPIRAVLESDGPAALAIISKLTGPFYRPLGAMMAVRPGQPSVGSLSSGCVEADIALNAAEALTEGQPRRVRYGIGSPAMDIRLPCGGGMEVLILPAPNKAVLHELCALRAARTRCHLVVNTQSGALRVVRGACGGGEQNALCIDFPPALQIVTFGDGPEAAGFAALSVAAGYAHLLVTKDDALRAQAEALGSAVLVSCGAGLPADLKVDAQTAIVLFYHDHEREPPILAQALETPAFYIGAQGSLKARAARREALLDIGVPKATLARLKGPIGLIPSVRDPQTLAISVLADVVAQAAGTAA